MAMATSTLPEGWWNKERSHHWMVYKKFFYFDDSTGDEFIRTQIEIRKSIQDVRDQLAEHQIDVINVATHQFLDHKNYGRCIGVVVAFRSREDLAMAKILVDCDEIHGL
jgi:hypothetical protein